MKSVMVSAHNPMTGSRHLGHYVSTMIEWTRIQSEFELFIVIDDLIATILYPKIRKEIQKRSFQVAKEFIATGIDVKNNAIVLTSMIPEVHELGFFTSSVLDYDWCKSLYQESFAGLLNSYQRRELSLRRQVSITEITYPQTHLATLTLGLHANSFQGGEEMRGYLGIMEAITEQLGKTSLRVPSLHATKCTFLVGTDGKHMGMENAVYLSSAEKEIAKDLSKVKSIDILLQWASALDQGKLLSQIQKTKGGERLNESINLMVQFLSEELSKFRESKIDNQEIAGILEKSALTARERIKETLIEVKAIFGIPGFVH